MVRASGAAARLECPQCSMATVCITAPHVGLLISRKVGVAHHSVLRWVGGTHPAGTRLKIN